MCRRFIVTGRVQGVAYRAWTRDQAESLALRGYAANLADGSVEVFACGESLALERLRAMLERGPSAARVASVDEHPAGAEASAMPPADFSIR